MFSANENLMLREHKRRVVQYVEDAIPENLLDLGTTVMVMQTACRTPGCVPLETAIAIVFPRPMRKGGRKAASKSASTTASTTATAPAPVAKELLPGLKESAGGTFKTKILLPLAEVTKDDVLDSLPPVFEGGRKTWERTCMALRDMMIGRIGGMVGSGDTEVEVEERQILAEYLQQSLKDYLARGCVAPELNEPFEKLQIKNVNDHDSEIAVGNLVIEEKKEDFVDGDKIASEATVVSGTMIGNKNFTIRRPMDDDVNDDDVKEKTEGLRYIHTTARPTSSIRTGTSQAATTTTTTTTTTNMLTLTSQSSSSQSQSYTNVNTKSNTNINTNNSNNESESAMDWRRRNNMTQSISLNLPSSSDGILQRLAEREHAPGVRSPGCPCCDPDSIQNVVDNMSVMF
eukprot:75049_1